MFASASGPLGLALARDPLDPQARSRSADLEYSWFLAAERDHQLDVARDLAAGLAQLDGDGSRRARLSSPAHLRVTTAPPGASVVLRAVHADADGRFVEDEARQVALATSIELPPGPYVLVASAPDRYATRLPVLLGRGREEALEIPLPPAAQVPPGFVFVPPGDSLIGAADIELVRTSLLAEPEHPVHVDAFLIDEHEVTYADYLDFLATLPTAERIARRPHAPKLDVTWDRDGVPKLTLGATTARRGEPLCRPRRSVRRCQDWLRFAVAGVSWDDARTFAAWRGGRVPGARLCSEREWQRAARGADRRLFTQGDVLLPGDANFDATYATDAEQIGDDEVGSYPRDRSPFGAFDLGGNVREWVGLDPASRAARGGSWRYDQLGARVAFGSGRYDDRYGFVGLRVCASAPAVP
jgi:formylglycine-generating enzyme required for sulfatase activity